MSKRWTPTVSGEQVITVDGKEYLVEYESSGDCYYDAGRVSGPPEDCYEPEGECEITELTVKATDDDGELVSDAALMSKIKAALDMDSIEEQLMETEPGDWR
tara:strand:+ start:828 stop:1133 length:306 start_codon:yes stop_codon:yes gene_type:complete